MEIVIPLLVIAAMFVIGLVNKSTQAARDTSDREPYSGSDNTDYYPENREYGNQLPDITSLETIEESRPFSYDDDIDNEVASVTMQPFEQENRYNQYMNNRVAADAVSIADKNDIANGEIKDADACNHDESIDFDGRKAIIYSEILRPKYTV